MIELRAMGGLLVTQLVKPIKALCSWTPHQAAVGHFLRSQTKSTVRFFRGLLRKLGISFHLCDVHPLILQDLHVVFPETEKQFIAVEFDSRLFTFRKPVKNLNELPLLKSCAVKMREKMVKSAYS